MVGRVPGKKERKEERKEDEKSLSNLVCNGKTREAQTRASPAERGLKVRGAEMMCLKEKR